MNAYLLTSGVALLVAAGFLGISGAPADPPLGGPSGASEMTFTNVASFDGHQVPITVYRPVSADAEDQVPVILHSHGWAGSREKSAGAFSSYVSAGLGVVSIDMRGHGDARSSSEARVHHVDYEIRDVTAVIDYLATLDWALLDGPGDPRLGAVGGSYGGGYQLLSAARDGRLDALAPEITWNDLPRSLAPSGAPKSAWIDLLYSSGNAFARLHPDIHRGLAWVETTNELPDGSLPGEPDLVTPFLASSAASYPDGITVPTLLVQGISDTLFNFNEAVATYEQIRSASSSTPVRLVTHLEGHILNTDGTLGSGDIPLEAGLQPPAGPNPCGDYNDLAVQWFLRHLLGKNVRMGADVCLALDDESKLEGNRFPLPSARPARLEVSDVLLVQAPSNIREERSLSIGGNGAVLAGIPVLTGTASVVGGDAIVYWTLEAEDARGDRRVLNSQVTPQRFQSDGSPIDFELDLMGIGARIMPGEALYLVASDSSDQYAHNGDRTPGAVTFTDLTVELPVVCDRRQDAGGSLCPDSGRGPDGADAIDEG